MLNLTGRLGIKDQGVKELTGQKKTILQELLTFNETPNTMEIYRRVDEIVELVMQEPDKTAIIEGPPWLMRDLAEGLDSVGIKPFFVFQSPGHTDFIPACHFTASRKIYQYKG